MYVLSRPCSHWYIDCQASSKPQSLTLLLLGIRRTVPNTFLRKSSATINTWCLWFFPGVPQPSPHALPPPSTCNLVSHLRIPPQDGTASRSGGSGGRYRPWYLCAPPGVLSAPEPFWSLCRRNSVCHAPSPGHQRILFVPYLPTPITQKQPGKVSSGLNGSQTIRCTQVSSSPQQLA